jgi:hypothetical protein
MQRENYNMGSMYERGSIMSSTVVGSDMTGMSSSERQNYENQIKEL